MPAEPNRISRLAAALLGAAGVLALANAVARTRAERRTPPIGRLVEVDGERVHVVERGSGADTVVLIHGNGSLAQDWLVSGVVERLALRHRVVIVERPGFGYTTRSRDRVWTPMAQARLIRAALDAVGVGRATIVGHSWGTLVAVAHALAFPAQTAAVGLLSGYYVWTVRPDAIALSGPAIPGVGDVLRWTVSPPAGLAMLPVMFKAIFAPAPVPEGFARAMPVGLMLRPSQLRASAADNLLLGPGAQALSPDYLKLARLPVLLMNGSGDRIVSPATHTRRLAAMLPGAEHIEIAGVGHMIQHSAPEAVADAIARLAERGGRTAEPGPASYLAPLAA